jgi:hypothetical protein
MKNYFVPALVASIAQAVDFYNCNQVAFCQRYRDFET